MWRVAVPQLILAGVAFFGITLAVTEHHTHLHYHRRILERGVFFAAVGAIGMGVFNFLVGVGSQEISPLMTIWFTNILTVAYTMFHLSRHGEFHTLLRDFRAHPGTLTSVCILDNLAWISFAVATTYIPIAIATTISESYVALAVLLGVFANKERLKWHQIVGVIVTIASVIFLAAISS